MWLSWRNILATISILTASAYHTSAHGRPVISLNSTNHLSIRGEVNDAMADTFVHASLLARPGAIRYVFINSPGGSVQAGNRIMREVQQKNYTCIADRAYSMGFVILQACGERLITPFSSVMQHPISFNNLGGDLGSVHSYVDMVRAIENMLIQMQAARVRLSVDEFRRRTLTEWWLFGPDIVRNHCADRIVDVTCSAKLMRTNMSTTESTAMPLVRVKRTFSRCPLVQESLLEETIVHTEAEPVLSDSRVMRGGSLQLTS